VIRIVTKIELIGPRAMPYPSQKFRQNLFTTSYRAMHFSANARSWDRMSSVRPSVCPSVTLVICDHIGWKSWKLIARTINPTPSLFVAKRRIHLLPGEHGEIWERLEVG